MLVHLFGAYFGLMVALFTARPGDVQSQSHKELSVYHSDLFTMIGGFHFCCFHLEGLSSPLVACHPHVVMTRTADELLVMGALVSLFCSHSVSLHPTGSLSWCRAVLVPRTGEPLRDKVWQHSWDTKTEGRRLKSRFQLEVEPTERVDALPTKMLFL